MPNDDPQTKEKDNSHTKYQIEWKAWIPFFLLIIFTSGLLLGLAAMAVALNQANKGSLTFFTTAAINILVFIAIVIQAYIYKGQWIAMLNVVRQNERIIRTAQRQARTAEKTLEQNAETFYIAERAYLALTNMSVGRIAIEAGQTPNICFKIKNGGRTPAFDVRLTSDFTSGIIDDDNGVSLIHTNAIVKEKIREFFDLHPVWTISSGLGQYVLPGAYASGMIPARDPLGSEFVTSWKQGTAFFYAVIKITYYDIRRIDKRVITYEVYFTKNGEYLSELHDAEKKDS